MWRSRSPSPRVHSRSSCQSSRMSSSSAVPSNWNSSWYQPFSRCSSDGRRSAFGWPTDSTAKRSTRSPAKRRERPPDRGAPVVARRRARARPRARRAPRACPRRCGGRRRRPRLRAVGVAEAAQVGRDRAEAGVDERPHLVAPQPRRVREAVQQQDRLPLALVGDGQLNPVAGHPPHQEKVRRCSTIRFESQIDLAVEHEHRHLALARERVDLVAVAGAPGDADGLELDARAAQLARDAPARAQPVRRRPAAVERAPLTARSVPRAAGPRRPRAGHAQRQRLARARRARAARASRSRYQAIVASTRVLVRARASSPARAWPWSSDTSTTGRARADLDRA